MHGDTIATSLKHLSCEFSSTVALCEVIFHKIQSRRHAITSISTQAILTGVTEKEYVGAFIKVARRAGTLKSWSHEQAKKENVFANCSLTCES